MPTSPGSSDGSDEKPNGRPNEEQSHILIESGCIRELAVHVLHCPETETPTEDIGVRRTELDRPQPDDIVSQLRDYDQLAAVLGTRDSCHLTSSRCTLAVTVDIGRYTWKLLAFEIAYPRTKMVYSIVGRRVDRSTESVVTVIDPNPAMKAPNTATIFEITTERVVPIPVTLDKRLPSSEPKSDRCPPTDVGYHVAIDWFLS